MYKVMLNNTICINEDDVSSKNRVVGQINKQVNSIDSLTFAIYPGNVGFDSIAPLTTTVQVFDKNNKTVFRGRVLDVTPAMDESGIISKAVTCEGALGYLCDSIWMTSTMRNVGVSLYLQTVLQNHNANVADSQKIYLGTVKSSRSYDFSTQYGNSLEEINRSLINNEDIGGEIRIRYADDGKNYLDYTDTIFNQGSDTKIELAVNMKSVSQTIDPKEIVTRVYPLGAKTDNNSDTRLSIKEQYIDNENLIAKYGIHAGTVIFDDVTTLSDLYSKGHKYVDSLKTAKVQYSISAADLSAINKSFDEFKVGTTYSIVNPLIGLDDKIRCLSTTIDLNDPAATTLTFGDKFETLTSITSNKISQIQEQITDMGSHENGLIKNIVANQTALLCGVDGGSLYYRTNAAGKPYELFFIDTDKLDNATQALRFNKNGMGFWSQKKDGGSVLDGPYSAAWTIDGTLHTEYIVANTLSGLKINNGNGTFTVSENGKVTCKNIEINMHASSSSVGVIKLSYSNNTNSWNVSLASNSLRFDETNPYGSDMAGISAGIIQLAGQINGTSYKTNIQGGNINTSGNISASGNIKATSATVEGGINADDITIKDKSGNELSLRVQLAIMKNYIADHP